MIVPVGDPMESPPGMTKSTTLAYRILDCVRMFPGWIPTPERFHGLPDEVQEELLAFQAAAQLVESARLQAMTTAVMSLGMR